MILKFAAPAGSMSVVIEDDGRVAYAYLLDGERIVGDVWLYNVAPSPDDPDWRRQAERPFLNPTRYCSSEAPLPLRPNSAVSCTWAGDNVHISVGGELWAHLWPGAKPGRSRMAGRAGPLAKLIGGTP